MRMFLVMLGGAVGSYLRYEVSRWCNSLGAFPWGTLFINAIGSFLLGMIAVVCMERNNLYLLLGTGLCGGFTTFSAFEWETFRLVQDGNWLYAFGYVFGSVIVGFVCVVIGAFIAKAAW